MHSACQACSCLCITVSGVPRVSFTLELTTPACPIKDEFERKARDYVSALPWVSQVRTRLLLARWLGCPAVFLVDSSARWVQVVRR